MPQPTPIQLVNFNAACLLQLVPMKKPHSPQTSSLVNELLRQHIKSSLQQWGPLEGCWVSSEIRDEFVDFVKYWNGRTGISCKQILLWAGIGASKYHSWKQRYGYPNRHNGQVPRSTWLHGWEKRAIIAFHDRNPNQGYRRLTYMMIDQDIVAVSPSSTYRVLREAGRLSPRTQLNNLWTRNSNFDQPSQPHSHWHIDITNFHDNQHSLIAIMDGFSRYIVHWQVFMTGNSITVSQVVDQALAKTGKPRPRLISDNGNHFQVKDFKNYIKSTKLQHTRTMPLSPQSNGKIERFNRTIKSKLPSNEINSSGMRERMNKAILSYNNVRLHSSIGYVPPISRYVGSDSRIHHQRIRKLEAARDRRRQVRNQAKTG